MSQRNVLSASDLENLLGNYTPENANKKYELIDISSISNRSPDDKTNDNFYIRIKINNEITEYLYDTEASQTVINTHI